MFWKHWCKGLQVVDAWHLAYPDKSGIYNSEKIQPILQFLSMIENDNEVRKTKWFPSLTDESVNSRRKTEYMLQINFNKCQIIKLLDTNNTSISWIKAN